MYIYANPNPDNNQTDDCVIRALSIAMNKSWDDVYVELALTGFMLKDMMDKNKVWGRYLRDNGFRRYSLPNTCPDCYTVKDFCEDYPEGTYITATGTHVIAVINGNHYDTWNSENEALMSFWKKEN